MRYKEKTLGENIQSARKAVGLTQKELAEKIGVVQGTVQQYELNKREPRLETLGEIANVLNTSVLALIPKSYWGTIPEDNEKEENMTEIKYIRDKLPRTEILAAVAEEASELAQAALKLRRACNGDNPTPKKTWVCAAEFDEEVSDLINTLIAHYGEQLEYETVGSLKNQEKLERWVQRLKTKESEERI
jgi:transcriptional regulator with XRE-family HTH domain